MKADMKPILFNTDMVRAILEGRKTVTRRVVKPQPEGAPIPIPDEKYWLGCFAGDDKCRAIKSSYLPGDTLYVRETWCDPSETGWPILYKADMPMHWDAEDTETGIAVDLKTADYKWRPSIHMPREAARIFLRVTGVQVERLQEITEEQAIAEGFEAFEHEPATVGFVETWNSTIKKADRALYGWAANPWVWVVAFERCDGPEDPSP